MNEDEISVIQILDEYRDHYYREPNSLYLKRSKKVPTELYIRYRQLFSELQTCRLELRQYFNPIQDKRMYVAKNHEWFNYETGQVEHDGEYRKRYGPDPNYEAEFKRINEEAKKLLSHL